MKTLSDLTKGRDIQVLLFDLGGVVIDFDLDLALQSWASHSLLPLEDIRRLFTMDEAYQKHERGQMEAQTYFDYLRGILKIRADDKVMMAGWNSIYLGVIAQSLDLIRCVNKKIPCYAFTNTNAAHQAAWMEKYPEVVEVFQHIFVSSEMGLRKPERAAFEAVAEATGISATSTLFFDDSPENVTGAKASGLHAVHVREPADIRIALGAIGLLENG